jgi:hypothetical protein
MKKFLLSTLFMLFFSQAQFAQNYEHCIVVVMNYDNGVYMGRTAEEIAEYEPDWYKDQPRYEKRFYRGFEEKLIKRKIDKICLLVSPDKYDATAKSALVVKVNILSVDTNGNTRAAVEFVGVNEPSKTIAMRGDGGIFGTWLNLFGDGMESLGENIVEFIYKNKLL